MTLGVFFGSILPLTQMREIISLLSNRENGGVPQGMGDASAFSVKLDTCCKLEI